MADETLRVKRIKVDGADEAKPAPLKVSDPFTDSVIQKANWNITKFATYIKPMVLLDDNTLVNLTADIVVFSELEKSFQPGAIYLTDRMNLANKVAKNYRSDGKHGTTEWDFNKVHTEKALVFPGGKDAYEEVSMPEHGAGSKWDVKKHCSADKFNKDVRGYSIFCQATAKKSLLEKFNAWSGAVVGNDDRQRAAQEVNQKQERLPVIPDNLSKYFSSFKYAVIMYLAVPAAEKNGRTVIKHDAVLRLYPNDNVRLTGKFLKTISDPEIGEKGGKLYAQIELYKDAYEDTLAFLTEDVKHDAYTLTGQQLLNECAKYGINRFGLMLKAGVEKVEEPLKNFAGLAKLHGKEEYKLTPREALATGEITYFIYYDDDAKEWKIDKDISNPKSIKVDKDTTEVGQLTALAAQYDYYKQPYLQRITMINIYADLLKKKYGDLELDMFPKTWWMNPDNPNSSLQKYLMNLTWEKALDDASYRPGLKGWLKDKFLTVANEDDWFVFSSKLSHPLKWIGYYWNTLLYEDRQLTEDELREKLQIKYDIVYFDEVPYMDTADIEKHRNFFWIPANGSVGIEGFAVPLTKEGNWDIAALGVDEETGEPVQVEYDETRVTDGGVSISTQRYHDLKDEIDELTEKKKQLEKENKNQKQKLLIGGALALLLMNN